MDSAKLGGQTLIHGQTTISPSSATLIASIDLGNISLQHGLTIRNLDTANSVYIGGSSVTSSTGFKVLPQEALTVDYRGNIYAIAETANVTVCWIGEVN